MKNIVFGEKKQKTMQHNYMEKWFSIFSDQSSFSILYYQYQEKHNFTIVDSRLDISFANKA